MTESHRDLGVQVLANLMASQVNAEKAIQLGPEEFSEDIQRQVLGALKTVLVRDGSLAATDPRIVSDEAGLDPHQVLGIAEMADHRDIDAQIRLLRAHADRFTLSGQVDDLKRKVAEGDDEGARNLISEMKSPRLSTQAATALRTIDELANLPEPTFLVQDFIRSGGFNVLFGPSGSGKSFLALDWNLCIAGGLPFYGQAVEQGPVVYLAAEGASGYYRRAKAWMSQRNVPKVSDFRIYTEPVNFYTGETAGFEAAIGALSPPPVAITVDTMPRCMVGGDENSAKDVGLFIDNAERVAKSVGAALLIVHHTGKNGELERGSGALRGAADTMVKLSPDGSGLKLTCEKQKDSAEFDPWHFHLAEAGESAVIRPGTDLGRFSEQERIILETVPASFGTDWVSATKIMDVSGLPKSTFYRSLRSLVERNLIEERAAGKQRKEFRAPAEPATVSNLPKQSRETDRNCPVPHTPLGVGQRRDETWEVVA